MLKHTPDKERIWFEFPRGERHLYEVPSFKKVCGKTVDLFENPVGYRTSPMKKAEEVIKEKEQAIRKLRDMGYPRNRWPLQDCWKLLGSESGITQKEMGSNTWQ